MVEHSFSRSAWARAQWYLLPDGVADEVTLRQSEEHVQYAAVGRLFGEGNVQLDGLSSPLDIAPNFDSAWGMGSQFMSLHVVDPALVQARLRGDFADLVETLYRADKPPNAELRAAFDVMARGTFVFLPKGQTHPEGLMYCRAVEYLLRSLETQRAEVEFYPDEGESPLWDLAFGRCEASWLDLPQCESGIGVISWKSPDTCRSYAGQIRHGRQQNAYNPRYSPASTLEECQKLLEAGHSSGHGLFAIFQG